MEDSRTFILKSAAVWAKGEEYSFAIVDRKDGTVLGSVALNQINRSHGFANVGYWVRQSRTRNGVASAATLLVARFGLGRLGLNRLEMLVPTDNVPSQRVAQKAGAKFEGVFRRRLMLGDKVCDAAVYSLVPEDLPGVRAGRSGYRGSG
jgi:RimJ/RimL family protein N-acetyltransferase